MCTVRIVMPWPGHLRADRERDALVRLDVDEQHVRPQALRRRLRERRVRRALELDRDRRLAPRRAACPCARRTACRPSASCRRRASRRRTSRSSSPARRPAPRGSRAPPRPRRSPRPYWPRTTCFGPGRVQRAQHLHLLVAHRSAVKSIGGSIAVSATSCSRWFWNDVADRARLLVERGAALDADRLGDGDLDVVDELAVPDRLEDPVREPQREHVLDRLLAEVVVDPEDLALVEVLARAASFSSLRATRGRGRTASRRSSRVQPSVAAALAELARRAIANALGGTAR